MNMNMNSVSDFISSSRIYLINFFSFDIFRSTFQLRGDALDSEAAQNFIKTAISQGNPFQTSINEQDGAITELLSWALGTKLINQRKQGWIMIKPGDRILHAKFGERISKESLLRKETIQITWRLLTCF